MNVLLIQNNKNTNVCSSCNSSDMGAWAGVEGVVIGMKCERQLKSLIPYRGGSQTLRGSDSVSSSWGGRARWGSVFLIRSSKDSDASGHGPIFPGKSSLPRSVV